MLQYKKLYYKYERKKFNIDEKVEPTREEVVELNKQFTEDYYTYTDWAEEIEENDIQKLQIDGKLREIWEKIVANNRKVKEIQDRINEKVDVAKGKMGL